MLLPSTFPALRQHLLPHVSMSLQVSPAQETCLQYYHNQTQQGYAMDRPSYGYCNCFQGPVTMGREFVIKACAYSAYSLTGRGQLHQTHHSKAVELSLYRCIPVLPRGLGPVCKLRPNNGAAESGYSRSRSAKIMRPWKTAWQQPRPTPSTLHGNTPSPHTGNNPAIP